MQHSQQFEGPTIDESGQIITPAMVVARNTGLGLEASRYRERAMREQKIHDSDLVFAEKLMANGIQALSGRRIIWLGDVTGRAVPLSPLRDINIYESVMQRGRAKYMKALQHFAQVHPEMMKYARYAVITTPQRMKVGSELSALKATMMKRISEWQRIIQREFQIEMLLQVTEFTFDKEDRSCFLHFNVLYWPKKKLSLKRWNDFLVFSRGFLGVWWKDNGVIKDFSEVIKYVLKSVDRDDIKKSEAAWFYEQLFRSRFITPYNAFAQHLAQLRAARKKLVYVADPGGGAKRLRVVSLPPLQPCDDKPEDDPHKVKQTENLIRGRTSPQAKASPWAEPGTLIEGYNPTPATQAGRRRLEEARDRAALSFDHWRANGAPDPTTALSIGDAWLLAPSHEEAEKIFPFAAAGRRENKEPREKVALADLPDRASAAVARDQAKKPEAPFIVHTTDLTLGTELGEAGKISVEPAVKSRDGPSNVQTGPPEGASQLIFHRNVTDSETGRCIGREYMCVEDGEIFTVYEQKNVA